MQKLADISMGVHPPADDQARFVIFRRMLSLRTHTATIDRCGHSVELTYVVD